jgi:superfamily I DNA/RNA helicase
VLHKIAASPREEGEWIADRIVELTQGEGVPFEEVAVLRRSLLDAEPLVDALASRSIPVDMAVSPGGSSARHLATLLAASAGEDPAPTPAASALVSPLCGVSPEAVRALRAAAEVSGHSVFSLIRSGDSVGGVEEDEIERARAVLRAVGKATQEAGFAAKVDALWKGLPATKVLFERHAEEEECARVLTDALSFVRSAHAYARMSQRPTVEGFLRAGKMLHEDSDTWAPSAPPAEGAVRLLTVHGSKGLEFTAVFVSGLIDERFPVRPRGVRFVDPGLLSSGHPTPRAELDRSHLFEERRLFYVALTRAKTYLFLTGVEESAEDGLKASPLLRELESRLVELAESARTRRVWADLGDSPPDGICTDAEGAVWYADVPNKRCTRVREGGEVLQTIALDRGCFACALGGTEGRTLFIVAREWRGPETMADEDRTGQILTTQAPAPGAGWP